MKKHTIPHAIVMLTAAGAALLVCLLTACREQTGSEDGTDRSDPADTSSCVSSAAPAEEETLSGTGEPGSGTETTTETVPSETAPADTGSPEAAMWGLIGSGKELQGRRKKPAAHIDEPSNAPTEQGGCFDGTYWYQAFIRKDTASDEKDNDVYIVKYHVGTGETVKVSESLPLNHANDITYNARRHVLVVAHNNPYRTRVSLLDPDTLTVTGTVELSMKIFSIDYNETRDEYVVGLSGGQSFCLLDADFRRTSRIFSPTDTTAGCITQGCGCDDRYIYFVLYKPNLITIYDWDGAYITTVPLNVSGEPEHISSRGGALYVGTAGPGATLYRVELKEKGG